MSIADNELARRAAAGEAAAFRLLLERHYDMVFRMAYRFLGSRADAEDMAQEVAVALASKVRLFKGGSAFSTWLYRVVINACRDHARGQSRHRRLQVDYAVAHAHREADWDESDRRCKWLYRAINELDPALKATALLILAEDLSHAQAGEILGVKESTVSWRMHEVRKKLKVMASASND